MNRPTRLFPIVAAAFLGALSGTPSDSNEADKTTGAFNSTDAASNWPQFRGGNASGVAADDVSPPVHFGPTHNVIWKTPVPSGVSSPCVWGNRIFLTCFDEEREKLETLCLDRRSGEILWRKRSPADKLETVHEISSPANATPTTDGKRVFVYFASVGLICYDFEGRQLWSKPMPLPELGRFGNGASPIVVDDLLIMNLDEGAEWTQNEAGEWVQGREHQSRAEALSCDNGKVVWSIPRPPNSDRYSTPVIWQNESGKQVILFGAGRLTGYDVRTGQERWSFEVRPGGVKATPLVHDDYVFVTSTGAFGEPRSFVGIPEFAQFLKTHDEDADGFVAPEEIPDDLLVVDRSVSYGAGDTPLKQLAGWMDRNGDNKISEKEWSDVRSEAPRFLAVEPSLYCIRLGGEGDITETNVHWRHTRGVSEVATPLVYQRRLYVVRNGGIVHCRDPQNGQQLFRGRLNAVGGYYASPVGGGGRIYFASDRGVISVLAASDEFEVLANNDLEEPIMATPALIDDTMYVRTTGHVYSFRD